MGQELKGGCEPLSDEELAAARSVAEMIAVMGAGDVVLRLLGMLDATTAKLNAFGSVLLDCIDALEGGLETEGSGEPDWSKRDRALAARARDLLGLGQKQKGGGVADG